MLKGKLPISYNPIQSDSLNAVLSRYDEQPHQQIITDFEYELAKVCGVEFAVALNSGTSAIHLALLALGVGPGDVVIVPTFTYVATVNPVLYVGARPVFVDSESDTWNLDPVVLEEALIDLCKKNCKPKAIFAVHTYGMPAKMDEILKVAGRYEIPVLEDAAEALGSTLHGRMAGTLGLIGIYSFNNNKIITTYGGGAILTNDTKTASRIRFLASQARENLPYYEHREMGFNYLIGALNAAYGLSQLPHLERLVGERRIIFENFRKQLTHAGYQREQNGMVSNRWLPSFLFDDEEEREEWIQQMDQNAMETRPLWRPMHIQPVFKMMPYYGGEIAQQLFKNGICFPPINLPII